MSIFCRHKWELLTETVTKSKFEMAIEALMAVKALGDGTRRLQLPWEMSDSSRKHIQVFACKCGKIKRFVEKI